MPLLDCRAPLAGSASRSLGIVSLRWHRVGEVGELCECFQWKGEVEPGLPGWSEAKRQHLGEEMADVLMYLIRLADKCGIDLPAAAERKIQKNAAKYPADLVHPDSPLRHSSTGLYQHTRVRAACR
jgi:NTP pyrophosphatase (non-canonical NTP hydrolase)